MSMAHWFRKTYCSWKELNKKKNVTLSSGFLFTCVLLKVLLHSLCRRPSPLSPQSAPWVAGASACHGWCQTHPLCSLALSGRWDDRWQWRSPFALPPRCNNTHSKGTHTHIDNTVHVNGRTVLHLMLCYAMISGWSIIPFLTENIYVVTLIKYFNICKCYLCPVVSSQ